MQLTIIENCAETAFLLVVVEKLRFVNWNLVAVYNENAQFHRYVETM